MLFDKSPKEDGFSSDLYANLLRIDYPSSPLAGQLASRIGEKDLQRNRETIVTELAHVFTGHQVEGLQAGLNALENEEESTRFDMLLYMYCSLVLLSAFHPLALSIVFGVPGISVAVTSSMENRKGLLSLHGKIGFFPCFVEIATPLIVFFALFALLFSLSLLMSFVPFVFGLVAFAYTSTRFRPLFRKFMARRRAFRVLEDVAVRQKDGAVKGCPYRRSITASA